MMQNDLIGFGLFIGYFVVAALTALSIKTCFKVPLELFRKMLHIVITMSILPLLYLFSDWYMAIIAAFLLVLIMYPILALAERTSVFKRFAPERTSGEFKRSLVIVQLSFAILIFVFWGILGIDWQYVAVVSVMAWGFGDAAAALVGKTFGRRRISHRRIEGAKTVEGTQAMFAVAWLAIFFSLLLYAGQPWFTCLAVATLVAPVCAVVELFSSRGMDTLTVPLSAAFAILPLMSLLSFLGV